MIRLVLLAPVLWLSACSGLSNSAGGPYAPAPRAELVRPYELEGVLADDAKGEADVGDAGQERLPEQEGAKSEEGRFLRSRFSVTDLSFESEHSALMDKGQGSLVDSRMPWIDAVVATDTLMVHHSWARVRPVLAVGTPVEIRRTVWPVNATVLKNTPAEVRIATGWQAVGRFSDREIRCYLPPVSGQAEPRPEIRLIGTLAPTPHGATVARVQPEVRFARRCELSPDGVDRIKAMTLDMWRLAHKAATSWGRSSSRHY